MILEKLIEFLKISFLVEIYHRPMIAFWKRLGILINIIKSFYLNRLVEFTHFDLLKVLRDRLGKPEVMLVE